MISFPIEKRMSFLETNPQTLTSAVIPYPVKKNVIALNISNSITTRYTGKSKPSIKINVKGVETFFPHRGTSQSIRSSMVMVDVCADWLLDFDTHQPTGRFCYGRFSVDYIALRLGLPFVPSYLGQAGSIEDMILGVNNASAAGIIFSSGSELGQHISLSQQVEQVNDTIQQFTGTTGEEATTDLILSSAFYRTNDYIHYYLLNASVQSVYLPWSFNQFLAHTIKQEIKNLFYAKVRKVVVTGLVPISCAPYYLWLYSSKNRERVETINDMILEFNFAVRYMVYELNEELVGANVIFCDAFEGSVDIIQNHDCYGFNMTDKTCCGLGKYKDGIMFVSSVMLCSSNASNHVWCVQFHPTDAVNVILAMTMSALAYMHLSTTP